MINLLFWGILMQNHMKHAWKISILIICFKNNENPSSCIDLILTNFPKYFQHCMAIESGLSDFHKMRVTVMK